MFTPLQQSMPCFTLATSEDSALIDGKDSLSHINCTARIEAIANWLCSQNARVVALHGDNSIDWVLVDLACQQANIVCVPLPAFFSAAQISHCLRTSTADLVLSDRTDFQTNIDSEMKACSTGGVISFNAWRTKSPGKVQMPEGTQKITFTSGSTGAPKGVCLSKAHQWQVARSLANAINIEKPRHLCLLPLSTLLENVAGIYSPLICGGSVHLPDDQSRGLPGSSGLNSTALLNCIERIQPNTMILLPQLLLVLVNACENGWRPPASLAFVAVGGARVAAGLVTKARSFGIPVYQGYGLSECGSVVTLNTPSFDNSTAAGKVLDYCKIDIEENEVVVSGSSHLGYLGMPESWYPTKIHTGDIGFLKNNFLTINGRMSNTLITAFGRNVSPEWIEAELMAKPLINHCVVVGDDRAYLAVLVDAPESLADDVITNWIEEVNHLLPDYAQLKNWSRIASHGWLSFFTENGRIRRSEFLEHFDRQINALYVQDAYLRLNA